MSINLEIRKSAEKGIVLISLMSIVIMFSGCTSYDQKTVIHEALAAKEISYFPGTQKLMHPDAEGTFKQDAEVIYACVNVTSVPLESVLHVRWHNIYGENTVFEDKKTVSCGIEGCWSCFNASKRNGSWNAGNYSVEFFISGSNDINSRIEFSIIGEKQKKVCVKDKCFYVELAATKSEITRGLMFRESLDLDTGMLFIFEEEEKHGFWMKNTLIPLDIIWINKENDVVFISKNTEPCKTDVCTIISPDKKAKYVLEVNGGVSDKLGLNEGDEIIFKIE